MLPVRIATDMTVSEKKAIFEQSHAVAAERVLLHFDGVAGFDVYNCSAPFVFRGRRHLFGRVERRGLWVESRTMLFAETEPDRYRRVRKFDALLLEDPFVTFVNGEMVLGGTRVRKSGGRLVSFRCDFFRGSDPMHLSYFTSGPELMKDIRLAPLSAGRIGVFSRPRGEDIRARYGSEAVVGYAEIAALDGLTPEAVQGAEVVPGLFGNDEWGGCNECQVLPDGRIGVAAHLCCRGALAENGVPRQIYCNAAFSFDPETRTATPPRIVATRAMHAPAPSKVPHLDDCAFTSGFVFRDDGLVDVYSGLGDAAEGRVAVSAAGFWNCRDADNCDLEKP